MSVDNGMIALNIYNKPPAQEANETTTKINQTEQNLNLNTERPQQKIVYYDNIRSEIPQNYSSAPRNNNKRNIESTIDESSDSTKNNQKKINKISPVVPVVPVVTKPVQYPLFQQINYQQIPRQPLVLANPQMIPYNAQYGQPIIVQGNYANNNNKINNNKNETINNAPKTIIIRKKQKVKSHKEEDCCTAFLAGCTGCLACMCLMGLCFPGPYHRRW